MNGAVDTSAPEHELVRGVHDRVDLKSRNVAVVDLQTGHYNVTAFCLTAQRSTARGAEANLPQHRKPNAPLVGCSIC